MATGLPGTPELTELDAVAYDCRKFAPARAVATALAIPLVLVIQGAATAFLWGGVQLFLEATTVLLGHPLRCGAGTRAKRILYLAAAATNNLGWLALSLIMWQADQQGSQFAALLVWATLLVNATSFAFRSMLPFLAYGGPVVLALTLTPLILPRFQGAQQVACAAGALILAGYALFAARRNQVAARELARATEELERERQAAEAANLAKSAFLATMSHEIRTPLNGVIGMAQAMARDDLSEAQRERLEVIRQAGEVLLDLLNDILDISRIEAGRMQLEEGLLDAGEIARSAQAAFTSLAANKDIHLSADVAPDADRPWQGDPTRVRQIVYNLVSNAVKFTDRGFVHIGVGYDGERLSFAISDTGPGIPPERINALFGKFVQADATTTRRYGGSGLGLAICRELAELMGGEIAVESRLGAGSTFTVWLPLAPAETKTLPEKGVQPSVGDCTGLKVLAAEDNPMNRQVLATLLGQLGIDLTVVGDGAQAVAASAGGGFDLILMDVQMPVMDGPSAARAIRAQEAPSGRRTPILALTANAMAHHTADYLAAGMDGVVAKPIQLAELIAAMRRALGEDGEAAAETG